MLILKLTLVCEKKGKIIEPKAQIVSITVQWIHSQREIIHVMKKT